MVGPTRTRVTSTDAQLDILTILVVVLVVQRHCVTAGAILRAEQRGTVHRDGYLTSLGNILLATRSIVYWIQWYGPLVILFAGAATPSGSEVVVGNSVAVHDHFTPVFGNAHLTGERRVAVSRVAILLIQVVDRVDS